MLQFNRKLEYTLAILAQLHHHKDDSLSSARQMAESTNVSYDMCTKCLQRLHKVGLCVAVQGNMAAIPGNELPRHVSSRATRTPCEPLHLVDCLVEDDVRCQLHQHCNIRQPISASITLSTTPSTPPWFKTSLSMKQLSIAKSPTQLT